MTPIPHTGTMLVPQIPKNFADILEKDKFFSPDELHVLRGYEKREQPEFRKPGESCKLNLFLGFFFDGTKNNYHDAQTVLNHSNVARLYDCYPGQGVFDVLNPDAPCSDSVGIYTNFFKVYIPGVASKFAKVGDEGGDGLHGTGGGGSGLFGERRIVWAMVQAFNHVHRFFLKEDLVSPSRATDLAKFVTLNHKRRMGMEIRNGYGDTSMDSMAARVVFEKLLRQLDVATKPFRDPTKIRDPGFAKVIHLSTFGFSRGATQARAFNNWMLSLCALDAHITGAKHTYSLGGVPVVFDFLGLYDTVASVGAGNTFGNVPGLKVFDGHMGWADAEHSLRINGGVPCVHLVAAHELRRSFPLDSISVKGRLPLNCWEIVVPGVHSDIGSGYAPKEQGKGRREDGADMLARVPLAIMYKMARLKGVPLKLELASDIARQRFQIRPETILHLNNYVAVSRVTNGSLTEIMRDQARIQMEWRLNRRFNGTNPLERTAFFNRCNRLDQNDFHSANLEFEREIAEFKSWFVTHSARYVYHQQRPGFNNERNEEWKAIAKWWQARPLVSPEAVATLFDEYVHDSRSWFKLIPGNPDSIDKVHKQLQNWSRYASERMMMERLRKENGGIDPRYRNPNFAQGREDRHGLTDDQLRAADEYSKSTTNPKVIPRMITTGREPYEWKSYAGYLRYRKIYAGSDVDLLS